MIPKIIQVGSYFDFGKNKKEKGKKGEVVFETTQAESLSEILRCAKRVVDDNMVAKLVKEWQKIC